MAQVATARDLGKADHAHELRGQEGGEEVVGIGRMIGDSGLFYEIVDVAVAAAHQKKGLGKMIMDALMNFIHTHAPSDAYVSLIADKGVAEFYEKYGFIRRGIDEPGMGQIISKELE